MARTSTSRSKPKTTSTLRPKTLILDAGAHTIKAGYASHTSTSASGPDPDTACHVIPNCIARSARDRRTYVGSQLSACQDFGELAFRRPVEKGFITNWEGEKAIWEGSLLRSDRAADGLDACEPSETNLVLTEAPHALSALQRNGDEMVFEEFGFANYSRVLGGSCGLQ